MPSLKTAILKAVVYADIFDFPLTKEEIWTRLIWGYKTIFIKEFEDSLRKINILQKQDKFYCLSNKEYLIKTRRKKEKWSEKKIKRAQKISKLLSKIPSVKLIGVSGSVAVGNAGRDDDIDLFIITSEGLLWTTRFFVTFLVHLMGVRRTPQDIQKSSYSEKICLNMFVDEFNMGTPLKEQNLYTAYEIVQMKPLFQRNKTYKKFLFQNRWLKNYLPNAFSNGTMKQWNNGTRLRQGYGGQALEYRKRYDSIARLFNCFELILKHTQLWYMSRRRTTETIDEGRIKFHPQDIQPWIMQQYREKLKKYRIK